jgi:hypothetical protein
MAYTLREQPQTNVTSLGRRLMAVGGDQGARATELLGGLFDRILGSMGDLAITGDRPEIRFRKADTLAVPLLSRYAILAATELTGQPPDVDAILQQLPAKHTHPQSTRPTVRAARIRVEPQEPRLYTVDLLVGNSYLGSENERARAALLGAAPGLHLAHHTLSLNLVEMRDVAPKEPLQDDLRGIITDTAPRHTSVRIGPVAVIEVAGPRFDQHYVSVPLQ